MAFFRNKSSSSRQLRSATNQQKQQMKVGDQIEHNNSTDTANSSKTRKTNVRGSATSSHPSSSATGLVSVGSDARNRSTEVRERRGRKQRSLLERPDGDMTGVFLSARTLAQTPPPSMRQYRLPALPEMDYNNSSNHVKGTDSPTTVMAIVNVDWKSSGAKEHHKNSPLVVSNPDTSEEITDEAATLGKIMLRSRKLPGTWYYQCNHIMVNQERTKRTIAPLVRLKELDLIARLQAEEMAADDEVFQIDSQALTMAFNRPARRLGANVAQGSSIRDIHRVMMANASQKNNMLDRRFTHMGMATARGPKGDLYLCQIYRG